VNGAAHEAAEEVAERAKGTLHAEARAHFERLSGSDFRDANELDGEVKPQDLQMRRVEPVLPMLRSRFPKHCLMFAARAQSFYHPEFFFQKK
jgi:hypothetical protein